MKVLQSDQKEESILEKRDPNWVRSSLIQFVAW